jgi:hypothetical protein
MRRIALTLTAALLAAFTGAGCSTMGPAALSALGGDGSGFSYSAGRAVQHFAFAPTAVQPAVLAAMDDLRIHTVRQTNDGSAVVFEGTTADNRTASVTLRPQSGGSRLSARIGVFGDQPLSRALMDRVGIRLGTLPPAAIPDKPPSAPASNPYFSRSAVPDSIMLKDQADAPYKGTAVP